jgi:hypothetical protein
MQIPCYMCKVDEDMGETNDQREPCQVWRLSTRVCCLALLDH